MKLQTNIIESIIRRAFEEDFPAGDLTTDSVFENEAGVAEIIAKDQGIIGGLPIIEPLYQLLDPNAEVKLNVLEGEKVSPGTVVATINAKTSSLLTGERTCLNILQRISGIATTTSKYVKKLEGSKTKIIDTRKTMPGLRYLDKYAVRLGGGYNHRLNLSDAVMLKDNHISAAGGISSVVAKVRDNIPVTTAIEVEVDCLTDIAEALAAKVDIIMLDNMDLESMKEAIEKINGRTLIEISGNVTLERISDLSLLGGDFISVGALTHSVKAFDLSMKLVVS